MNARARAWIGIGAAWIALGAAAPPGGAERTKARLDLKAAPLADALAMLKEKLGVAYAARDEILAAAKPVTLAGEFTREEAIAEVARQAGVRFEIGKDGIAVASAAAESAGRVLLRLENVEGPPGSPHGAQVGTHWNDVVVLGRLEVSNGEPVCAAAGGGGEEIAARDAPVRDALLRMGRERGPAAVLFHGAIGKSGRIVQAPGLPGGPPAPSALSVSYAMAVDRAEPVTPERAAELAGPLLEDPAFLDLFLRSVRPIPAGAARYYVRKVRPANQRIAKPGGGAGTIWVPSIHLDIGLFNGTDRPFEATPPAEIFAVSGGRTVPLPPPPGLQPGNAIRAEARDFFFFGGAHWVYIVPESLRGEETLEIEIPLRGPGGEEIRHRETVVRRERGR